MSSSKRNLYAGLNEQLGELKKNQLARDGIHDRSRMDDSISQDDDDDEERQSGGENGLESMLRNDDTRRRTRSRDKYDKENQDNESRESGSRGRHIPESIGGKSSPTDYNVRHRQVGPSTPVDNRTNTSRSHSTPQRAAYGGDESTNFIFIASAIGILVLLAMALLLFYFSRGSPNDQATRVPKQSMADIFVQHVNHLKEKSFPNQRSRLWSTVRSSIRGVLNRSDGQIKVDKSGGERSPAVVLLVADAEDDASRATTWCLAKRLAEVTSHAFAYGKNYGMGYRNIEGSEFIDESPDSVKAKKLLETELNNYLGNTKASPVVVLRNVHLLPPEAALILHAYCDNENAPFKEAVYFLTIDCGDDQDINATSTDQEPQSPPIPIWKTNEKDWDRTAENCLRTRWLETGKLSMDKIAPILSRIANNVVFVYPEPTVDC